jgi:hypothetical protein
MEGLRYTQRKPLNYAQLSQVKQGREETPSGFLERLRQTLVKHNQFEP